MNWLNRYADPVYCIVRIMIGLLFACHGTTKIFGFPPSPYGPAHNPLGLTAGWIEMVGGLLIAFGFLTRLAAFICSGEMAVAYFMTSVAGRSSDHAPTIMERLLPIMNGGEFAVVLCFVFFFMVFYGPSRWSIDFLLRNSARPDAGT
jgi:putative oxidoreductase